MGKITDRIKEGKILVSDGAWGTFRFVRAIIDAGVNIIGGGCGTTPGHIRQIAFVARES